MHVVIRRIRVTLLLLLALESALFTVAARSGASDLWTARSSAGTGGPGGVPPTVIRSQVSYGRAHTRSGRATAAEPRRKSPACWYEPRFTPAEFEDYIDSRYGSQRSARASLAERDAGGGFHNGEKGAWWYLVIRDPGRAAQCAALPDWRWVGPGGPGSADTPLLESGSLGGLAYNEAVLPPPAVVLRPVARNQVVNLGTEVALSLPPHQVSVTARFDNDELGIHLAATTVAVPVRLRVEAGTSDADPRTCTYALLPRGGAYAVDPRGSSCSVTYRRASPHGGYPLTVALVWQVSCTRWPGVDGASATESPLPDAESVTSAPVTVREIVALNR